MKSYIFWITLGVSDLKKQSPENQSQKTDDIEQV